MKRLPGVSIVIPSYNDKDKVFRLLNSVKKSTYLELETIVVVNGSKDTLERSKGKYPWVKWVYAGEKNIGQTGCYNLGFVRSKKKNHIIYCDSDVVLERNTVGKLVQSAQSNPKIGIVTPMILYLKNKNWVNQAGANVNLITGRVKVGWGPKKEFLIPKEVQNSGTVLFIKRQVVDKIGGFDNWFLCYFDADYCLRAKKEGFIIWYEPTAVAYHDQSKDPNVWRPRVLQRAYLLGRNRIFFMRKHGNMVTLTLCLPFLLGYYLLESLEFNNLKNFPQLVWGTMVGYLSPIRKSNYIPLPIIRPEK